MLALTTSTAATPDEAPSVDAFDQAREYRELSMMMDEVRAELGIARTALLERVIAHRNQAFEAGRSELSIPVPSGEDSRVLVVWRESYRTIPVSNEANLRQAFGSSFDRFVERVETVALERGTTLAQLEAAAGDLSALLVVSVGYRPRKGSLAQVADLYREGRPEMAADLLEFCEACMSAPQIRCK